MSREKEVSLALRFRRIETLVVCMKSLSNIVTRRKIWISVLFGILSLGLSPFGITAVLGETRIDIPWAIFLPILISMAYGWRFGLLAGLSGGAMYPFWLWPNNGWANLSTSLVYLFFYALIGIAYDKSIIKNMKKIPVRVFIVIDLIILVFCLYYLFLFNPILKLNPAFWVENSINKLPLKVLQSFLLKNSVNIIILTIISGTLIRLPLIRKLLGLPSRRGIQANHKIFVITMFISALVWISFVGLDALLFEEDDAMLYQHSLLSFFVITASGFIASRIIFYYAERQYKMQHKLNKSEGKFRAIFENSNDAILIIEDELFADCNPVTLTTFGCSQGDIIGKSPFDFTPQYQSEGSLSTEKAIPYKNSALNGEPVRFEWQHLRFDGTTFDAEVLLSRLKFNRKILLQAIIRDISERKRAEKELITAKEHAEQSDKLKSAFLANMSHEIRTPLNSIIGFSELISDPDFEPRQQLEFARMINDSGNNLLAIINDIMDISKIESGQVQLRKNVVSVNTLLTRIQKEYSFKSSQKGVELRLDPLNPKAEITVESDGDKLGQILINLVGNAIKFTENGFIEIGFIVAGDFLQFHVKDSGIGISPGNHHQIFERFRQVESAYSRKYGGTGLGLPISKSLVEMLGGIIWVESDEGKGSTFYFTVPK